MKANCKLKVLRVSQESLRILKFFYISVVSFLFNTQPKFSPAGSSPLDYLDTYIKEFVACKINPKNDGCREILESKRKINKSVSKESTAAVDLAFEEKPFFEQYE